MVHPEHVLASLVLFSLFYLALLLIWLYVINEKIRHGPPAPRPHHAGRAQGLLDAMQREGVPMRVLRHDRRSGQSAAIVTGVRAATAPWILTLDGDGQNDPADAPALLARAWEEDLDLVGGLRLKRQDTWSRRVATRFANGLRQALLKDGCVDTGCGLKVVRREVFLRLPYFSGLHRFLPALVLSYGGRVAFVPVGHRPRQHGQTKYTNWRRALVGIADLRGVMWLRRRTILPTKVTEE